MYGSAKFLAIEVKNTGRIRTEDLRGLKAFKADYPEATLLLLYRGEEKIEAEGILCMNVAEFLCGLACLRCKDIGTGNLKRNFQG